MGFATANQLINSHTSHKHIHNPKKQDYFEIINIILQKWGKTKLTKTLVTEPLITKINIYCPKGNDKKKN